MDEEAVIYGIPVSSLRAPQGWDLEIICTWMAVIILGVGAVAACCYPVSSEEERVGDEEK